MILQESVEEFRDMFFEIAPPSPEATKEEREIIVFRLNAAKEMMHLENTLKNIDKPVKKAITRVQGGCS
jgi:hypothetical protein